MTKPDDSNTSAKSPTALHPAYSVSNIQSKIRTLDGTTVTYSSWVKLFRFQAMAYRVVNHIDDTPPPGEKDSSFAAWKELDALVSQWIYSTVSDDILTRILDTDDSARTTWLKLEKIFLSNKQAKAAALETKFVNLTLAACSSVDDYCKQLKDLANQLADVDQPVTESRLVIQLVRGLSAEFDTTASLINSQKPNWDLARSMLHDEVIRQAARQPQTPALMVAPTAPNPAPNTPAPHPSAQQNVPNSPIPSFPHTSNYRGRGRGRNHHSRGRGTRGSNFRGGQWGNPNITAPPNFPPWAWWNTPPCPYPTKQ